MTWVYNLNGIIVLPSLRRSLFLRRDGYSGGAVVLGVVLERKKKGGLCDVLALLPALPLVFDCFQYANKEGEGQ